MVKRVMVPLDGSDFSQQVLPVACTLARESGATLYLVHVHVPYVPLSYAEGIPVVAGDGVEATLRAQARHYLDEQRDRLQVDTALMVHGVLLEGDPAYTLADYAAEEGIDLIVMNAHGRGGLARAWLGSVADTLIRHVAVPLLLLRGSEDAPQALPPISFHHILIPLDGSALAEQVLEPTFALGEVMHSAYHLLYVINPVITPASFLTPGPDPSLAGLIEDWLQEARHYLADLAARLKTRHLSVTTHIRVGEPPAAAILAEAKDKDCGVIAMSTHGYGGLRRLLLGSVADKVLRSADRPILLYPALAVEKGRSETPNVTLRIK